jgi:hypothetical protein
VTPFRGRRRRSQTAGRSEHGGTFPLYVADAACVCLLLEKGGSAERFTIWAGERA